MSLKRPTLPIQRPTFPLKRYKRNDVWVDESDGIVMHKNDDTIIIETVRYAFNKTDFDDVKCGVAYACAAGGSYIIGNDNNHRWYTYFLGIVKHDGTCDCQHFLIEHNKGTESDKIMLNTIDVSGWECIVKMKCAKTFNFVEKNINTFSVVHVVGLREDGTCVAEGDNTYGQCNVNDWEDIVDIECGIGFTIGIKSDGTCVATGKMEVDDKNKLTVGVDIDLKNATDIVQIRTVDDLLIVGLHSGGTCSVLREPKYTNQKIIDAIENMTEIVYLSAYLCYFSSANIRYHCIGVKQDGTIMYAGPSDDEITSNESVWERFQTYKNYTNAIGAFVGFDEFIVLKEDGIAVDDFGREYNLITKLKKYLYKVDDETVYGYSGENFEKLTDSWSSLSEDEKIELFEGTKEQFITKEDFKLLQGNKLNIMEYPSGGTKSVATITAIPKTQLVKNKVLMETSSFLKLNRVIHSVNLSGNGIIKIAVSKDNNRYVVWNKERSSWDNITATVDGLLAEGMTPKEMYSVKTEAWESLISHEEGSGIGFAYVLDITDITDKAEIDTLSFNVAVPYDS